MLMKIEQQSFCEEKNVAGKVRKSFQKKPVNK